MHSSDDKIKIYINRKTLAEDVADKIKEQISLGHYEVNEKLPIEPELMKTFGVGRSSIREAIKLLSNAGLLRVLQGVGTFVEKASSREPLDLRLKRAKVEDLNEVRQLLEIKIAEKAALNRTDEDIGKIKKPLNDRKIAADRGLTAECIDADIQFHIAIAEDSKNAILDDLYNGASVHLKEWFMSIYPATKIFIATQSLHEMLLKYIAAGNAKMAWSTAAKIN